MSLATDNSKSFECDASVFADPPLPFPRTRGKERRMTDNDGPLLIKRYASRRLYNTETSDYVTLDDIMRIIEGGRDVKIVDLKTGDDMTRQYLLQIIAEHESKGENVLPLVILTELIRSYSGPMGSVVPKFLAASFEVLQANPAQVMQVWSDTVAVPERPAHGQPERSRITAADLADIRKQLAELQDKLSRL